jgi:hypothetical protein
MRARARRMEILAGTVPGGVAGAGGHRGEQPGDVPQAAIVLSARTASPPPPPPPLLLRYFINRTPLTCVNG